MFLIFLNTLPEGCFSDVLRGLGVEVEVKLMSGVTLLTDKQTKLNTLWINTWLFLLLFRACPKSFVLCVLLVAKVRIPTVTETYRKQTIRGLLENGGLGFTSTKPHCEPDCI